MVKPIKKQKSEGQNSFLKINKLKVNKFFSSNQKSVNRFI